MVGRVCGAQPLTPWSCCSGSVQACARLCCDVRRCLFLFKLPGAGFCFAAVNILVGHPGVLLCMWAISLISSGNFSFYPSQFSSVHLLSRVRLCDPMNRSTPGLPVHHHLLELTQTHVHRVGDAIQPSHSLSSPSPPAPNPSQHQSLFQ